MGGRSRLTPTLHRSGQAGAERFCQSFIGRLRDELLNETMFRSLPRPSVLEAWRADYGAAGTHSRLGWMSPATYAADRRFRCATLHGRLRSANLRGCVALRSRCAALRLANSRNGFGISTLDRSPRYLERRWPVRHALVGSASPIKSYTRRTHFSKRNLSVPFRLHLVRTVILSFSSRTASCVQWHGWEQSAFQSMGAMCTKARG